MQHKSALYRLRKTKPNVPFIRNVYRQGQLFNDGKIIELPNYEIVQKTDIDFELHVPEATKISLCKKQQTTTQQTGYYTARRKIHFASAGFRDFPAQ